MSGGGGFNDWESDLSSIIEKTNQNLKLLRRIGDRRSDLGTPDVSTTTYTARPATTSAAQIASDMRGFASSLSQRYAAEDANARHRHAATTSIPRAATAASSATGTRKLHRSSSVEVDARARARESLILRPAAASSNVFGGTSDGEDESDERSPPIRHATGVSSGRIGSISGSTLKRSSSLAAKSKSGATRASTTAYSSHHGMSPSEGISHGTFTADAALDELRKSLEIHVAARSTAFEKALADLRTDVTVVVGETNSFGVKMQELRDAVQSKLSHTTATTQAVGEHGESIARLEKHSAVLLGWKVGVDQDLFEITTKLKSFASVHEKITSLEGHLEALGVAIKAASRSARADEKVEELKDRVALLERQAAHQLDAKAVEHTVQMRVSKEINELESRFNQSLQFLTQKLESKCQSVEKTVQSDRIDAVASLKSELLDDLDKLESRVVKKAELTPVQNTQTQLKDDIAHIQLFFERQDKRFHELKQNATQIHEELAETRHELTKALHAQQSRVSTTLEEKVGQLSILTKAKNAKAEQKVLVLEKRTHKVEEQCRHLQESVAAVKQDARSRHAAETVAQQRETEQLRQRLVRSLAELEQLHVAKQEMARSFEAQERQYQATLKELKGQIDEHERAREALRSEMLEAIQSESRQMGMAQGRNTILESLLSREKQGHEEKAQQVLKARQEMAQVRQKMKSLESEVDKKVHKLSAEIQSKQSQIEMLNKKLVRSEEDAHKRIESVKREKDLLVKTRALKQQELAMTKLRMKELEKAATLITHASSQDNLLAPRLAEAEVRRNELQSVLAERQVEVDAFKAELQAMQSKREELVQKHAETMDTELTRLHAEYSVKVDVLQQAIVSKDAELGALRDRLVDKGELETLGEALTQARREKESLLEQLAAAHADCARHSLESEVSLRETHSMEMEKLQSQIERRVVEIAEAQGTIEASSSRIAMLESEMKASGEAHKEEVSRLACEMKEAKLQAERLSSEMETLRVEKRDVDNDLSKMRSELESISAGDDELLDEMDNLRLQYDELSAERDRLIEGLRAKSAEVAERTHAETQHRERITQLLQEQHETSARVEEEIELMRQTIERERDAAAASECRLQHAIEILQTELETSKNLAVDGASSASRLDAELQRIQRDLAASIESEVSLRERLNRIVKALETIGVVASMDEDQDPCQSFEAHVHALAEKHAHELAQLSATHEQALQEAAADHERAHVLETQITSLTVQLNDLETSNQELHAEMEKQCRDHATTAQEMGRLQEEMSAVLDQKHALEEQVAELSSQVDELEASLQSQADEKEIEAHDLKETNTKLSQAVREIRETMERLETDKITQLESLSVEIHELETTLASLTEGRGGGPTASMEKELAANQQIVASAGQTIRTLHAKLTGGCSVVELQKLRASIMAEDTKHKEANEQFRREQRRLADADDDVVRNVEFLNALVKGWNANDASFANKYVRAAPALATRLSRLQERFQEALQQCALASQTSRETEVDGEQRVTPAAPPGGRGAGLTSEESQNEFDEIGDEEDLEEADASEHSSVDLSASRALDESHDGCLDAESHGEEEDSLDGDWRDKTERVEAADEMPCGTPDSGATVSSRTDASTTLLHSPTATLLERRFESVAAVQLRKELALAGEEEETMVVDPCTTLPSSPTTMLLQETFQPFQTRAVDDDEGESEQSDHESSLQRERDLGDDGLICRDGELDGEGEQDAVDDVTTTGQGRPMEAASYRTTDDAMDGSRECVKLDSGSDEAEVELNELDDSASEGMEDHDSDDFSLSQSLESMVRLAAGEELAGQEARSERKNLAGETRDPHGGDDDDDLIDDESDSDDGDDGDAALEESSHAQEETSQVVSNTTQRVGDNIREYPPEDSSEVHLATESICPQTDSSTRTASREVDEEKSMVDDQVGCSTLRDDEQHEFDEEDDDVALDESLECSSTAEDEASEMETQDQLLAEDTRDEDDLNPAGVYTGDEKDERLGEPNELEPREVQERYSGEIRAEQSGDLDCTTAHVGEREGSVDGGGRMDDLITEGLGSPTGIDADELEAASIVTSSESSPVKALAVSAVHSIPSLPFSRIAALRRDIAEDDELHAAQLSMDLQRRGMQSHVDDDEFEEVTHHEEVAGDQLNAADTSRGHDASQASAFVPYKDEWNGLHGEEDEQDEEEGSSWRDVGADDDEDDADFDRVLSASKDDNDEEEAFDQQHARGYNEEDSMDEVERLLLQHGDDSMGGDASPERGRDREFASALRMDDDDEEVDGLIDSESEGDDEDELLASMNTNDDEDDGHPVDALSSNFRGSSSTHGISTSTVFAPYGGDDANDRLAGLIQSRTSDGDNHAQMNHADDSVSGEEESGSKGLEVTKPPGSQDLEQASDRTETEPHAAPASFVPVSRVGRRNFNDSDEDEDDDVDQCVVSTSFSSQLAPLSGLRSRARGGGGGSGSLLKALEATRGAMAPSDFDDDMDEVEKLMASTQSVQRTPLIGTERQPTVSSASLSRQSRDDSDDEDEDMEKPTVAHNVQGKPSQYSNSLASLSEGRDVNLDDETHGQDQVQMQDGGDREAEPAHEKDVDELGDLEGVDAASDQEEDEASVGNASGSFGMSFGDDILERALAGVKPPPPPAVIQTASTGSLSRADSESVEDSEDDAHSHLRAAAASALPSLQSLGKKPLPGLSALSHGRLHMEEEDDDDMDEVERLMQAQTSMRSRNPLTSASQRQESADEDDTFNEQAALSSPPMNSNLPVADDDVNVSPQRSTVADFDDEDEDETEERTTPRSLSSKLADWHPETPSNVLSSVSEGHVQGSDSIPAMNADVSGYERDSEHAGSKAARQDDEHERDESESDVEVGDRDEDETSVDDASGDFGMSFGDDILEQALAGPKPTQPTSLTTATQALSTGSRSRGEASISAEDDSEDDAVHQRPTQISTGIAGLSRQLGALQPLGKKPLPGLTALTRGRLHEEDDDMDEVERLLLEQTSMRTARTSGPVSTSVSVSASASRWRANDAEGEEEDDKFDGHAGLTSPLRDVTLPIADDDEFAHFDRDDQDEKASPRRRIQTEHSGSESGSQAGSAPPSPSRIPILPGSSLLKKPLGSTSPVALSRPRQASARSEDDGADAYLEDSFDLEESLQEDDEQDV